MKNFRECLQVNTGAHGLQDYHCAGSIFGIQYLDLKIFHILNDVIYNNERYFINNGTTYDENGVHLWDICRKNLDGVSVSIAVPESDLKKAKTWFNFKHSLLSYYKWYMQCWYKIDVNKKIIDRLVEDINNE